MKKERKFSSGFYGSICGVMTEEEIDKLKPRKKTSKDNKGDKEEND